MEKSILSARRRRAIGRAVSDRGARFRSRPRTRRGRVPAPVPGASAARSGGVLLDKDHGHFARAHIWPMMRSSSWTINGPGLRAVRRAAAASGSHQARAIASICCSPPESWLPMLVRAFLQARKQAVDALAVPWPGPGHDRQVFLDRERRKMSRSCGTQPRPSCARPCAGTTARSCPGSPCGRLETGGAHQRRQQRGLAHAVAPSSARLSASRG